MTEHEVMEEGRAEEEASSEAFRGRDGGLAGSSTKGYRWLK